MPHVKGPGTTGKDKRGSRKEQILEALANMLEATPGGRITTAALAREVGVSEAALYRHFPSKTRMFDDLITFIDETLNSRIDATLRDNSDGLQRCRLITMLILQLCETRPGIARVMIGDAITGEEERLRQHLAQLFERLYQRIGQVISDAGMKQGLQVRIDPEDATQLIMTAVEGHLCRFVRSDFRERPVRQWERHWGFLADHLFIRKH